MLKRGAAVKLQRSTVKVVENLSEGGYAYVHKVKDAGSSSSRNHFAVKQIVANDAELTASAVRERELMASLAPHPNIVAMLDWGSASGSVLLLL